MAEDEYRSVTRPILQILNKLPGCKAINIHGNVYTERGTPDIIGCYKGRMFLIETKNSEGRLRPDQEIRIQQWKDAGAVVRVMKSKQELDNMISTLMKNIELGRL